MQTICPYCQQPTDDDATACQHCRHDLHGPGAAPVTRTTPRVRQPSGLLGYLAGGLGAGAVLAVVIFSGALEAGSGVPPWLTILVPCTFFGVAHAINVPRRHAAKVRGSAPVLVMPEPSELTAQDAATGVASARVAGRIDRASGRFVLSPAEVDKVRSTPHWYTNVAVVLEREETGALGTRRSWHFVFGPAEAIAIRQDDALIWSVLPDGIKVLSALKVRVTSADGRIQVMEAVPGAVPLVAWSSATLAEFTKRIWKAVPQLGLTDFARPNASRALGTLVKWSWETGTDPRGWLRFALPFGDEVETLRYAVDDPEFLAAIGSGTIRQQLATVGTRCGPDLVRQIQIRLGELIYREARQLNVAGAVLGGLGVGVAVLLAALLRRDDAVFGWCLLSGPLGLCAAGCWIAAAVKAAQARALLAEVR